jgi:hypothetical protein
MDRPRRERGLAAAGGFARGIHCLRFFAQQRIHLAAFLILLIAAPVFGADDITFDPAITQDEFRTFSRIVAQGIFATPVQPARTTGLLGFDIGVAATAVKVDTKASYWQRAVPATSNFTQHGYAVVPRLVVSKGFGSGTLSGSYAKVSSSGIKTYGGSLDLPVVRGSLVSPELALRASYATMSGVEALKLKTYGLELFLSKAFGPFMPYGAIGRMRSDARATIPATSHTPEITLNDRGDINRYTVGFRLSLVVPKLVVEATQAQVRSYAAKISVGF